VPKPKSSRAFSLKRALALAAAERKAFWSNSAGGLAIAVFLGLSGILFYNAVADYAAASLSVLARGHSLSADLAIFSNGLANLGLVILLVSPLTTMRARADYAQGGHLDLLLAWPLTPWELAIGQFLAATGILSLLAALSLVPFLAIWLLGVGSLTVLLTAALGLLLLAAAFSALGLALASLNPAPMAAALTSLGALALLWSLGWAAPYLPAWAAYLAQGLAIAPRLAHFALGLVDLNDVAFFLALTLISLWVGRPAARA
jgi:ABC-2 type transport system permease protein